MRWRWARALPGISSVMSVLHLGCLYYCIAVLQRGNTWCSAMLQRAMQCNAMQCNGRVCCSPGDVQSHRAGGSHLHWLLHQQNHEAGRQQCDYKELSSRCGCNASCCAQTALLAAVKHPKLS